MRSVAILTLMLWPAAVQANDIDVELSARALQGQSKPVLTVHVRKAVSVLDVNLTRLGKPERFSRRGVKAGAALKFELDAPLGTTTYAGELAVTFAEGGNGSMPLRFAVEVAPPLTIESSYERLDLAKGTAQVRLNRAASHCDYAVLFDGKAERKGTTRFAGEAPGTWLTVKWQPHGAEDVVLRIQLTCHDTDTFFSGLELFPWSLDIPHEDVVFDSGKWDITATESPKLDRALVEIQKAIRRYAKVVDVKLFVGGHTDSVGKAQSNQVLSVQRAMAIARYFRRKGVRVPILAAGFGESRLAIATADETPEIRNRRAEYVIAVREPTAAKWRRVR